MKAIQLVNATIGTVSSKEDGSVAFRVNTAELRGSEKGLVMEFHGRACQVTIEPHEGVPDEVVTVTTEREQKSQSSRFRSVLFVAWKQKAHDFREGEAFEQFYSRQYDKMIDFWKGKLE